MVPFSSLAIGAQFTYNNEVWVKVTPVKKSCCKIIYNAHVVGNKDVRQVFQPNEQVNAS